MSLSWPAPAPARPGRSSPAASTASPRTRIARRNARRHLHRGRRRRNAPAPATEIGEKICRIAGEIFIGREQIALFDLAHIGTLHSFCCNLVREHFHELGLDPQLAMLDEGEARQLADETLDEQFQSHYDGEDEFSLAVQNLIQIHGGGRDEKIRALILRLHHYSQTRPDAAGWLAEQIQKFSATEPAEWQGWLLAAIEDWRDEWLPVLENLKSGNEKAAELAGILSRLGKDFTRELAAEILEQIVSADGNWPAKRKSILRKPLADFSTKPNFSLARASQRRHRPAGGRLELGARPHGDAAAAGAGIRRKIRRRASATTACWIFTTSNNSP